MVMLLHLCTRSALLSPPLIETLPVPDLSNSLFSASYSRAYILLVLAVIFLPPSSRL